MKPTRQFKPHTAKRRREAKIELFKMLPKADKFKMILRQKGDTVRFLFYQLADDERKEFLKKHFKGVKVKWQLQPRQVLKFSPFRLVDIGHRLQVFVPINGVNVVLELGDFGKPGPNNETILQIIQANLPTVKVL